MVQTGSCITCNNKDSDPKECLEQPTLGNHADFETSGESEHTNQPEQLHILSEEGKLRVSVPDRFDKHEQMKYINSAKDDELEKLSEDNAKQDDDIKSGGSTDTSTQSNKFAENVEDTTDNLADGSHTNSTSIDSNSTILHWLKFIIDPILEEFIYVNVTDTNNTSDSNNASVPHNVSNIVENVNATAVEMVNITYTTDSTTNTTDSSKKVKFQCVGRNVTDNANATVKLITTARLLQMLNFEKNGTENVTDCVLVMFYAPWCHFCAKTAPHYNALARAFPQLDFVAVDTAQFSK